MTNHDRRAGRRGARVPRWPILLIALGAFVSIWSGWVGLGRMAGFGPVELLPGIADGWTIDSAITLPLGVEAYAAYALWVWLAPVEARVTARARSFARASAIAALGLGVFGQATYHLLVADGRTVAPGPVVVFVACLPVLVLGAGAGLVHLIRDAADDDAADDDAQHTDDKPDPAPGPADLVVFAPADVTVEDEGEAPARVPTPTSQQLDQWLDDDDTQEIDLSYLWNDRDEQPDEQPDEQQGDDEVGPPELDYRNEALHIDKRVSLAIDHALRNGARRRPGRRVLADMLGFGSNDWPVREPLTKWDAEHPNGHVNGHPRQEARS